MKRRLLVASLAAASAAASGALYARDVATGLAEAWSRPSWQAQEFDWVDERRQRAVPARLYTPTASMQSALPLVLFSHGIGGSRRGYSYIGQHLASQGFASLHVQHVGSDRALWGGNVLSMLSRLQDAASRDEALSRVLDIRFALDQLLAEQPGLVDEQRIAAAGHSYGANTSLLLAGAAVPGGAGLADSRVRAAVFISAPPLHGVPHADRALTAIRIPTLHVTATDDTIRVPGYFSTSAERVALFEATGSAIKGLAVFEGGSHSVFTDRAGTGGVVANPRIKAATKTLLGAFLREAMLDESGLVAQWHASNAPLLQRWVAPGQV